MRRSVKERKSEREKAEKVKLGNKAQGLYLHTSIYEIQAQISFFLIHLVVDVD